MSKSKHESSISSIEIKEINMKRLLNYVYNHAPISKKDLAYNLSLSIPTINAYIKEYENANIIVQDGTFSSTGGRKAVAYKCNSSYIYGIGVYITGTSFTLTIVNLIGEQIRVEKVKYNFEPTEKYGQILNDWIEKIVIDSNIQDSKIYGVGFSIPGTIEKLKNDYIVKFSRTLKHKNWSFNVISKYCKYPFIVDNDASFGAYLEAWESSFKKSFAYLHIAGGVGGAIFIDGQQMFGAKGSVNAKFGHLIVQPSDESNNIEIEGRLQAFISTNALSTDINTTLEEFFSELNRKKDYQARFNKYLDFLCIGINNIKLTLGLDVIVAGEIIEFLAPYENLILEKLFRLDIFESRRFFYFSNNIKDNVTCKGAAIKVISEYIAKI